MSDVPDDDELEEELRQLVARADPVPPVLVQAAVEAFSWRDIDAELAQLVFDSLVDEDQATAVRGAHERRMVSFAAAGLTIDIEVVTAGSGPSITGQIAPPQRAAVEIRHGEGSVSIDADELGRFQSASLRPGPMSLRLRLAAGGAQSAVVTDWVSI